MKPVKVSLILFFILTTSIFAINELSVLTNSIGSSKPGFIDETILVIEPHGSYFEQSLYLKYSDHNQFSGNSFVEIVHRFELPEGSVVNDMWLWIGDSIMQAKIYDVWTARAIYDSIVTNQRDPAFLAKKGNQYELHVYPLVSGSFRKVKLNLTTPTNWIENEAFSVLPLKMLKANNANIKPIDILFRQKHAIWGVPDIQETNANFVNFIDTLGYSFQHTYLEDISNLESLTLTYTTNFNSGSNITFLKNSDSDTSYFQLGILPADFFDLQNDTSSNKVIYALDLSGDYNDDLPTLIPNLKNLMLNSMGDHDQFKLLISGAGIVDYFSDGWVARTQNNVDQILNSLIASNWANQVTHREPLNTVFCDYDAKAGWYFEGLEDFSTYQEFHNIMWASGSFTTADIIVGYKHGFDNFIGQLQLNQLLPLLEEFFLNGGRFITFFDLNRNNSELLARNYIPGLMAIDKYVNAVTLYRNNAGNIGRFFPEEVEHNFVYTLGGYNDPDVKVELYDVNNKPVVISKKIGNGLLVVTGIWSIVDDGAMKSIMSPGYLGLNQLSNNLSLENMLDSIKTAHFSESFDKAIIISNSDSLYTSDEATVYLDQFSSGFQSYPEINTINLLDGSEIYPPNISIGNVTYNGSGILLDKLSETFLGQHFETSVNDFNFINNSLTTNSLPTVGNLTVSVDVDGGSGTLYDLFELSNSNRANQPVFFVGSSNADFTLNFSIDAQLLSPDTLIHRETVMEFSDNPEQVENIIPQILANEQLNDLLNTSVFDTAAIVSHAMRYNLVCDYTALLALEPNDSNHFMINPFDESGLITEITVEEINSDSTFFDTYPNPFNNQVTIEFNLAAQAEMDLSIYNILGEKVIVLINSEVVSGHKKFIWNGRNQFNNSISSGIYILVAEMENSENHKRDLFTRKMLLVK